MLPVSLEKFYEGLPQLFPYFAGTDSLEADVAAIGRFVSGLTACEKLMVVRLDDRNPEVCREAAIWGDADLFGPNLHGFLQARLKRLLGTAWETGEPDRPRTGTAIDRRWYPGSLQCAFSAAV